MAFVLQKFYRNTRARRHSARYRSYVKCYGFLLVLAHSVCCAAGSETIDFTKDVQPILARNCVACHNENLAEGGLNLESHSGLEKGGDSGESFIAGRPASSYLISRVNGDEEPWMPPEDNAVGAQRLTAAELEIIETWIEQGAKAGLPATKSMLSLSPPSIRLTPTYDMEFAPDGSFLAYGRGSNAYVLPIHLSRIGELPATSPIPLLRSESTQSTTHLDLVQSIAVSPDSQRIATGGYKQVHLWRQVRKWSDFASDLVPAGKRFTLSGDGEHLAYQTGNRSFEIIDLERGVSQRYLKTHQEPLVAIAWIDETHIFTCDVGGNCFKTNIDGNQQPLETNSDSDGVIDSAVCTDEWLYVVHRNSEGQLNLSRRSIATTDESAAWDTIFDDFVIANESSSSTTSLVHAGSGNSEKLAYASGQTICIIDCESFILETEIQTDSPISAIRWNPVGTGLLVGYQDRAPEVRDAKTGDLIFHLGHDYAGSQRVRFLENQHAIREVQKKKAEERIAPAKALAEKESKAVAKLTDDRDKAAQARDEAAKAVAETERQISELETKVAELATSPGSETKEGDDSTQDVAEQEKAKQEKAKQQLAEKQKSLEALRAKQTKTEADLAERQQALSAALDTAKVTTERIPIIEAEVARITEEVMAFKAEIQIAKPRTEVGMNPSGTPSTATLFHSEQIVVAHADRLSFFSAIDGSPIDTLVLEDESISYLTALPGSNQFLAYTHSGRVYLISFVKHWELEKSWGSIEEDVFPDRITALDFSPDGRLLAIGSGLPSRGGDVYFVDLDDEVELPIKKQAKDLHSDQVLSLSFSPDGRYLASGAADKICHILETENGSSVRKLEGHSHHILGVSWRWDGQTLATAGGDGTTKVWNVEEATQMKTLTGLSGEVTGVQYVGTTNTLVAVSTGSHARRIDAGNGKVLNSLGNSQQPLFAVTTTSPPSLIAAAGQMGSIWIWNAESGKLEAHIKGQTAEAARP